MPTISDPPVFLISVLAISGVIWFALGSSWNLKRGRDTLRWLREGLPALGERTTMQWLGTSAVRLTIAKAKEPFKEVEIVIVMEPRDVPLLWLHGHLQGRRDTLIFRGHLRQPPQFEIEFANPNLWTGREALAQLDQKAWKPLTLNGHSASAYITLANQAQGEPHLRDWVSRSTALAPELARLSLRRSAHYHLQWHSSVPTLTSVSAQQIIQLLRQIGRQASEQNRLTRDE